jgi:protein-S-isoprenylcysteine O-methyltransferase
MPQTRSRASHNLAAQSEDIDRPIHANGSANQSTSSHNRRSASPTDASPLYHPRYATSGPSALTSIAAQSLGLGMVLSYSFSTALQLFLTSSALWRLPFFIGVCTVFHFLEFWCTARWNSALADRTSFLIVGNGLAQTAAYAVALLEVGVKMALCHYGWMRNATCLGIENHRTLGSVSVCTGFFLIAVGQLSRSMAMMEAGTSFNHLGEWSFIREHRHAELTSWTVQYQKQDNHVLVTSGIFSYLRHPSYFGFFYWALGTQLVLGNTVSFVAYALVLWKFFSHRVMRQWSPVQYLQLLTIFHRRRALSDLFLRQGL